MFYTIYFLYIRVCYYIYYLIILDNISSRQSERRDGILHDCRKSERYFLYRWPTYRI